MDKQQKGSKPFKGGRVLFLLASLCLLLLFFGFQISVEQQNSNPSGYFSNAEVSSLGPAQWAKAVGNEMLVFCKVVISIIFR